MQAISGYRVITLAALPRRLIAALVVASAVWTPVRAEDLSTYSGPELFRVYCASCHGVDGKGDGPVAASLRVEVPDLTRMAQRQGGRFSTEQVRRIIDGRTTLPPHGTRDMPIWGHAFRLASANDPQGAAQSDRLIDLLVQYLWSIQKE